MNRRVENQPTLFQKQAQVHFQSYNHIIYEYYQMNAKKNMEKKYKEVLKQQVNQKKFIELINL